MHQKNIVHHRPPVIDAVQHKDWFDAICTNDVDSINQILEDKSRKHLLMSGLFDYADSDHMKLVSAGSLSSVYLPLAVAAVVGATPSIKALLQAGVCPKQVDCHGNNVVHSMIAFLHYNNDMKDVIISKFQLLVDTVSVDVMKEILHHENSFGLRPIEFAAQHGQGSMVLAIMNTLGVYLTKQQVCSLTCYKWYNITEYESTGSHSRRNKSPLLLMTYVDTKTAYTESFSDFMGSGLIQCWLAKRLWVNIPLLMVWCLIRFTFIMFYMLLSLDMSMVDNSVNSTACVPGNALILSSSVRSIILTCLVILLSISLLLDVADFIQMLTPYSWPQRNMISGRKRLFAQVSMYRVCHFLLCLFLLVCTPMMYGQSISLLETLASYSQIINPVLAAWSTLYFVQLLPSIGFFIIAVYSMVKSLGSLMFLYVLMNIPFIQVFYTFINTNSLEGCIDSFSDVFMTFYSLFLMMLNIINLTSFNITDVELLYATHVLFTFSISILLINFLVAVMSDLMATLSTRRNEAEDIQRSSVVYTLENHVKWFMRPYYRFMVSKLFIMDQNDVLIMNAVKHIPSDKGELHV